ncbi:MAG: histidine--tRNA ligase [bacterium]
MQEIRGTKDLWGEEVGLFRLMEAKVHELMPLYDYTEIRTPIFESTEIFVRGIGEATDIVSKEMYTFSDRKGRSLTLRPEGTAPVVRALLQHQFLKQQAQAKFYYIGPMFRYERPMKGRQRQFHQIGVEYFGSPDASADAEVISVFTFYLESLGFRNLICKLNTLGSAECRRAYSVKLRELLLPMKNDLCTDCQTRIETNPMRVLDCKNENCQAKYESLPSTKDVLDEPSQAHYDKVRRCLDGMGIAYVETPKLVRGLDYYTHTVFEACLSKGLGTQDAVFAGGRYDGLVQSLGGPAIPAVGASAGMERIALAMVAEGLAPPPPDAPSLYFLALDESCVAPVAALADKIRRQGFSVRFDGGSRSLKSGLRQADKSGIGYAVIMGSNEMDQGKVLVKNLAESKPEEVTVGDLDKFLRTTSAGVRAPKLTTGQRTE